MNDLARPATMKPTPEEYRRMAAAIEADLGSDALIKLLTAVLPVDVVAKLIVRQDPEYDISKADVAKIVRKLQELVPGDRSADILWAVSVAERTFETQERAEQFIEFATHRVKEFEDKEAEGVVKEPIDLLKVVQHGKNRVDYSKMIMEDRLDFANIDGGLVRSRASLTSNYWGGGPMGGLARYHCFWKDGGEIYGGHFDWIRVGGQPAKTIENIGKGYLNRKPPAGATMYFCMISSDAKRRTDVVESKTKYGG